MFRPLLIFAVLAALTSIPVRAATASDWTKLKTGMNSDEAVKQLGQPLMRTSARGVEIWIYDGHGEIVFDGGPLKFWSVAAPSAESLARPVASDVLIRATKPPLTRLAPVQALPQRSYQEISTTHFRTS